MTAILYAILGLSFGVGLTLIYLQERFIRERRLLVAVGESERAKAAQMIKDLDEQWERTCSKYKQEIEAYKQQLSDSQFSERLAELEEETRFKDSKITELGKENDRLQKNLVSYQKEIDDLQGELTFLKGEINRLEEERKKLPVDNDFIVFGESGHLLPGSVARAFIKSNKK